MIDMTEVGAATETLARAFEDYKQINDQRLGEIERRGSADVVLTDHLGRLDGVINKIQDDVSSVKAALRRPARGELVTTDRQDSEYKQAFLRYVTKGSETPELAAKSMTVIGEQAGGFTVPVEMSDRIVTRQFDTTPMRQIATVMSIGSEAVEMLRDTSEPIAQWVSETAARTDTDAGNIGRIRIPAHEVFAQPRATQKLLDDSNVNIEDWLINRVADRFARAENAAFVTGDGITQPRGFLSYTTAATSDATRAWGVLEHVPSGLDGGFNTSTGADTLITLRHRLRSGYLPEAVWLMSRAVADLIRKFKETTSNAYIWQPGLQAGMPSTLLGHPVILAEDMPTLATNSLSLAFGNFREGYTIVDRLGLRVLRDPYTAAPFVKFRCTKRVGGDVVNFEAIKLMRFSAT